MNAKEKVLKAIIELAVVEDRIDELKRAKTYMSTTTYFRNRLRSLEEKADKLRDIIEGKDDVQELKLTFEIPQSVFKTLQGGNDNRDIVQYLKREFLVQG